MSPCELVIAFGLLFGFLSVLVLLWVVKRCPICNSGTMKKIKPGPHGFGSVYACTQCTHSCWREED